MDKSQNNKTNPMLKLAGFIVDKRNLIFLIYIILTVFSVFSRNWTEVENDLTYYLPSDAETKVGLDIMESEFVTLGSAKVMIANISYDEALEVADEISARDDVQSLTFDNTTEHYNNASALYDVTFNYPESNERCLTALNEIKSSLTENDLYVSSTIGQDLSKTIADEMTVIIVIVAAGICM